MRLRPLPLGLILMALSAAAGGAWADEAAQTPPAPRMTAEGGAEITPHDASTIAAALLATAAPQRPTADLKVGDMAPGHIDLRPLPASVAELVPEYRGFHYAVSRDRIAIVQPATRRIVEVIAPAR